MKSSDVSPPAPKTIKQAPKSIQSLSGTASAWFNKKGVRAFFPEGIEGKQLADTQRLVLGQLKIAVQEEMRALERNEPVKWEDSFQTTT
jgi:hypothetical protein